MFGESDIEKKVRDTLARPAAKAPTWEELVARYSDPWAPSPYAPIEDHIPAQSDSGSGYYSVRCYHSATIPPTLLGVLRITSRGDELFISLEL